MAESSNSSGQSTQKKKSAYSIGQLVQNLDKVERETDPTLNDYLNGDAAQYFDEIKQALRIIEGYKDGSKSYQSAEAAEDCLRLAAIHSSISEMVGYLQGISSRAEQTRRVVKSQYHMMIKDERDRREGMGDVVRVTDKDIDHASRTLATDAYESAREFETVSRMITAAWHSIGDFVRVLNASCNRAQREINL